MKTFFQELQLIHPLHSHLHLSWFHFCFSFSFTFHLIYTYTHTIHEELKIFFRLNLTLT